MMRDIDDHDIDEYRHGETRYVSNRSSGWSWLSLLFIPIAFVAGWLANSYATTGNLNTDIPGVETGVGGGAREERMIIPSPTSTVSPMPTEEPSPSPTMNPTMTR